MELDMISVGFIGTGNMGSALARAAIKAEGASVYLYDKDTKKAEALAAELGCAATDLYGAVACDVVFLAVKPNILRDVLEEIKPSIKEGTVLVSMAAGVSLSTVALVMGNEGSGISRLVKEKCDFTVSIPLYGSVNSMNVSCAATVLMCEVARQRNTK